MKSHWSVLGALALFLFAAAAEAQKAPVSSSSLAARRRLPAVPEEFPKWTFQARGAVVSSPALSANGSNLYVGSLGREFYAIPTDQFDVATNKWSLRLPGAIVSSPVIDTNGVIYVGCMDDRVYAIADHETNGVIYWSFRTSGAVPSSPAIGEDGTLYFGSTDNRFFALFPLPIPAVRPAVKWTFLASNDVSTPLIAEDGTIFFTAQSRLHGVTPDGTEASRFAPRAEMRSLPALGLDEALYFGADDERVYSLGPGGTTNDINWRFDVGADVRSSPAVGADGRIYIGSDRGLVFCFDENGALIWRVPVRGAVRSALSIGPDGTVFVGTEGRRMYAITRDGEVLWEVITGGPVRSSPAIDARGTIYFGSNDRFVYAVETLPEEAFPLPDDEEEEPNTTPAWQMFRRDQFHTARATNCSPFITAQPVGVTFEESEGEFVRQTNDFEVVVNRGDAVEIIVQARAGVPVSFQWLRDGEEIALEDNPTATNRVLAISAATLSDVGDYTVLVTTECGEVESELFYLDVLSPPQIVTQPTNRFLLAGNTLSLSASVEGTPPLTYQWFRDGMAIAGATNSFFVVTNAQPALSGNYFVQVTNPYGTTNSQTVMVAVFDVALTLADHPVGAGRQHSLAVLNDGTLWAWGLNNHGQLGNGQAGGSGANFVLTNRPVLIGSNGPPGTNAVWANVSAGSRGYDPATNSPGGFSAGIQTNGALWVWGLNDRGQLGLGNQGGPSTPTRFGANTNWIQVEAGATHTIALQRDGTIWAWGGNEAGQLGIGTTNSSTTPVRVGNDSAWVEVRAGGHFTLARRADGTIWGWGTNTHGQLGLGNNTTLQRSPRQIGTDTDWAGISAGLFHSLGVKSNGTLWAWGRNNFGQLGVARGNAGGSDSSNTNRPAQVGGANTWRAVEAGSVHSFAIDSAGKLFAWGGNQYGQLGIGTMGPAHDTNAANINAPAPVAPELTWRAVDASSHSLGMTVDGRVYGWGWNNHGQVGDGTGGDGSNLNNRPAPVLLTFVGPPPPTNTVASNAPPTISQQPTNRIAAEFSTTSFSVIATGAPPVAYQWYFSTTNATNVIAAGTNPSATNATLTLTNVQASNAGFYQAILTNAFGRATSTLASLTVTNASGVFYHPNGTTTTNGGGTMNTNGAPVITQQPTNQTVRAGTNVNVVVVAEGAMPMTFHWRFNTNDISPATNPSATNSTLMLTNVTTANSGGYDVVISNSFGVVTSMVATITVTNAGGPPTPGGDQPIVRLGSISGGSKGVAIEVRSSGGKSKLVLEYKDALDEPAWKPLSTNDGSAKVLHDTNALPAGGRYYRVRAE